MSTTYAAPAEILVTLASFVSSSNEDRVLFEAASTADQAIYSERATAKIDNLKYRGGVVSIDQQLCFPRQDYRTGAYIDPDPNEDAAATVTRLPLAIRRAHAVQSAYEAAVAAGLGNAQRIAEEAHRGVMSAGSGGRSESIDLQRANSAGAGLCKEAYDLLRNYIATGVDFV